MTSVSQNVYIDKLDDIVNKYSNTYHKSIKMKPFGVKTNTYINSSKEINDKDPKFKIGHTVRISKYKKKFVKVYVLKKLFLLKKLKTFCCGHMLFLILTEKKLLQFYTKKRISKNKHLEQKK